MVFHPSTTHCFIYTEYTYYLLEGIPYAFLTQKDTYKQRYQKSQAMDVSPETIDSYLGRPVSKLPTPSVILSKPVLESNIQKLSRDVKDQGIGFRPHVKTLKVSRC